MKERKGNFLQGYNAQAIADQHGIILAAAITNHANDTQQLTPMIAHLRSMLTQTGLVETDNLREITLLADAGYCTEKALSTIGDRDPDCYIATANTIKHPGKRRTG